MKFSLLFEQNHLHSGVNDAIIRLCDVQRVLGHHLYTCTNLVRWQPHAVIPPPIAQKPPISLLSS